MLTSEKTTGTNCTASNFLSNLLRTLDLYREHFRTILLSVPRTSPLIQALATLEAQLDEVFELKDLVLETVRFSQGNPPPACWLDKSSTVPTLIHFFRQMTKRMTVTYSSESQLVRVCLGGAAATSAPARSRPGGAAAMSAPTSTQV